VLLQFWVLHWTPTKIIRLDYQMSAGRPAATGRVIKSVDKLLSAPEKM
jgi:hypothetical protein